MLRTQSRIVGVILLMAAIPLAYATPTLADELTGAQKQQLSAAKSALKQVTTNLAYAQSSAGSGTSKLQGSKAKLTKVRLNSASANVPTVKKCLAQLPVDHSDVTKVQTELSAAEASIAALEARLKGDVVPAPSPAAEPTKPETPTKQTPSQSQMATQPTSPPSATPASSSGTATKVKMGYQQVDVLKAAKFNLRETESGALKLSTLLQKLQLVEDQLSISFRQVSESMAVLENARRKSGFTKAGLNQLPSNGEGVAETVARLDQANAQLETAETFLKPVHVKLAALVDPANYPEFNNDAKRLGELSGMFRDPMILLTNLPRAANLIKEAEPAKAEAERIAKAYGRLIQQQTDQGNRIDGSSKNVLRVIEKFLAAAEKEKQNLPGKIKKELVKINEMATNAVTNQKPLFFTGGIPQAMDAVKQKVNLFAALDSEKVATVLADFEKTQANLNERAKSLEQLIFKENRLPNDVYKDADREKVIEVAIDAWKHQEKDFDVLISRIPSTAWARETMWQFNNGTWYFVDRSKLYVRLIVADKKDPALAIIRPVTIIKDHQKGDTLIGVPMYSGKDALQPSAYLLRTKIK